METKIPAAGPGKPIPRDGRDLIAERSKTRGGERTARRGGKK